MPKHYRAKIYFNIAGELLCSLCKNSIKEQSLMLRIQKQDVASKERKVLFTTKIELKLTNNQHILKESYH